MKCVLNNLKFKMFIAGDGGYNNRSHLWLYSPDFPWTAVADPWDLSNLSSETRITSFSLDIPSGYLKSLPDTGIRLAIQGDSLLFSIDKGVWNGKQAGLLTGESGYGVFCFDSIESVVEGTYMIPEDNGNVSWETYTCRMEAIRQEATRLTLPIVRQQECWQKIDYVEVEQKEEYVLSAARAEGAKKAHEFAAIAANLLAIKPELLSRQQEEYLQGWWESIQSAVEDYIPPAEDEDLAS